MTQRTLYFDEPVDEATLTVGDLSLTGPGIGGSALVSAVAGTGDTFTVSFAPLTAAGDYALHVGADILDVAGNPMAQDGADTFRVLIGATWLSADTTIDALNTAYEGLDVVVDGSTLTVTGEHTFNTLWVVDGGAATNYSGTGGADGGASANSNGGGGGGGRIAVYALVRDQFDEANVFVDGGPGRVYGQAGSVHWGTLDPGSVTMALQADSDTGASSTDLLTADNTPTFDVTVNQGGTIAMDFDDDGIADMVQPVPSAGTHAMTSPFALDDGDRTVTVTFTVPGGTASASQTIHVDTEAPQLEPGEASPEAPLYQRDVTFTEEIDPATLTLGDLSLTGPSGSADGHLDALTGGGSEYVVAFVTADPLAEAGQYELSRGVRVADVAGNVSDPPLVDAFELLSDATAPEVTTVTIQPDGTVVAADDGGGSGRNVSAVRVTMSEPIGGVDAGGFTLVDLGPDGRIGGGDDAPVAIGAVTPAAFTIDVDLGGVLSPGRYRLAIDASAVTDGGGNPMGEAFAFDITSYDLPAATAIWISDTDGSWADADNWMGGAVPVAGGSLFATGGGVVDLPNAVNYTHASTANNQYRTFRAEGDGSTLNLGGLRTITGGTHYGARLQVEALAGGHIDLGDVTQIVDPGSGDTRRRSVDIIADGADSVADLSSLVNFIDVYGTAEGEADGRYSSLAATGGGTVLAGSLTTLEGVDLHLDASAALPTAQITTVAAGRITVSGADADLSGLTTAIGTQFVVVGAEPDLSSLADIDGSSFSVRGGGRLWLPAAQYYSVASTGNNQHRRFEADGAGSRLDLSNLTAITGGTHYGARLSVDATGGGQVDLGGVTQIVDPDSGDTRRRSIDVAADGAGSAIDLGSLVNFIDVRGTGAGETDGRYSSLAARGGGTILAGSLATLAGVDLALDGGGAVPTAQITTIHGGRVTIGGAAPDLSGLVDATEATFVVTGVHVDLGALRSPWCRR